MNGQRVGYLDRNEGQSTVLSEVADKIARHNDNKNVTMDILVEAVGRVNTGVEFDLKGLISPLVLLNSEFSPRMMPSQTCKQIVALVNKSLLVSVITLSQWYCYQLA